MGEERGVRLAAPRRRAGPVRVVLVRPTITTAKLSITAVTCPPIGLAYIAGTLVAEGHDVSVVDAIGEAPTQYLPTDHAQYLTHGLTPVQIVERIDPDTEVFGVSCMFSHDWPMARQVIDAIRAHCPDALIAAGGEHMTAVPEESLRDCPALDVAILGEGEETMAEVVRNHRSREHLAKVQGLVIRDGEGGYTQTGARPRIRAVDAIPEPAWDLMKLENYLDHGYGFGVARGRSLPMLATRGCPYQCTFCSNPQMWTTRYEAREPALVLDEIRRGIERYGAVNVDFYDLTFILRKSWIVEFCELVLASGLHFTWQLPSGTRSEAIDEEVVGLLYDAGCRNMSYAPESGSPEVLERIKKKVDLDRMKRSISGAVKAGINCKANILIGFPGERRGEIWQSMRFMAELAWIGLHDCTVAPFSPYPGTELFDELRAEGRIGELDDDYYLNLSYSDMTKVDSWTDHVGSKELAFYRLFGMSMFYGISYLRRPTRAFKLARSVFFRDTQESRLEQALHDMVRHLRLNKGQAVATPSAAAGEPVQLRLSEREGSVR